MKKHKTISNVPDRKNAQGDWLKSYYSKNDEYYTTNITRAGILWMTLENKCLENGLVQKKNPTYEGCLNLFGDFNSFAEWCNQQEAYMNKEAKRFWSLDKDILYIGNKEYSQEKCCFVPNFINCLFSNHNIPNSDNMQGVYFRPKFNKFVSQCQNEMGKREHLGHFETEIKAHKAWQLRKSEVLVNQAKYYLSLKGSREDVYLSIINRANKILEDYENNQPTLIF